MMMGERGLAVRPSDEWLRAVEAGHDIGFWSWDVSTAKLITSPGLMGLLGVNAGSVQLDLAFLESLVHPGDRLVVDDPTEFALDPRQTSRNFRLIRPDGQLRHLHSRASRFFDRDGRAARVVAVVTNVTEQHETAVLLAKKRALLHVVARIVEGTLWVADDSGRLLERFGGPGLAEPEQDVADWRSGMHPEDAATLPQRWRDTVGRRRPYIFSPRLRQADGLYRQFHIVGLPFSPEHSIGNFYGGISTHNPRLLPALDAGGVEDETAVTPAQVRACRALLDWTAETLARNAGISVSTVRRIEGADGTYGQGESLRQVLRAFQAAGLTITHGEDGRFSISHSRP